MDIYLTNLENSDLLRFPMLPSEIKITSANRFYSYDIIDSGQIKLPVGTQPDTFSWDGILPGESRKNSPYVRKFTDPKEIYKWLLNLKNKNNTPCKLRLLITDTPINHTVYLDTFTGSFQGGYGDFYYQITFVSAKDIIISPSKTSSGTATNKSNSSRPPAPTPKTHTVVKGDCLWAIANKYMGNGSLYPQLYEANKSVIDPINQKHSMPKYTIYPGQVLTIPS